MKNFLACKQLLDEQLSMQLITNQMVLITLSEWAALSEPFLFIFYKTSVHVHSLIYLAYKHVFL